MGNAFINRLCIEVDGDTSQGTHQNNSCGRANKGVEESTLKRQPAARKEKEVEYECLSQGTRFLKYMQRKAKAKK